MKATYLSLLVGLLLVGLLFVMGLDKLSASRLAASRLASANNVMQLGITRHGDGGGPAAIAGGHLARKIIYTADLQLIVEDFGTAEVELVKLAVANKGFVAKSEITGQSDAHRTGTWTMRVPVNQFEAFLAEVAKLGMAESTSLDSKTVLDSTDVTNEYQEVEARVRNKKLEEERLLKHLDKTAGKLEEILAVERELTRVRGDIEENQRKMRTLSDQTTLTTVTVTLKEIKGYTPMRAQTFGSRAAKSFQDSVNVLGNLCQEIALGMVALLPWLPMVAIALAVPWLLIRRRLRRLAVALHKPAGCGT